MVENSQVNVSLRALEPSDVDCLYIWENDPSLWQNGCIRAPMSRHRLWEYIQVYEANPDADGQLRLMIDVAGTPVGTVDLYDFDAHNGHAFVGIMIAPAYRCKGYAKAALNMICSYCKNQLAMRRLGAFVAEDNEASLALFRSAGFKEITKLSDWLRRTSVEYVSAYLLIAQLDG